MLWNCVPRDWEDPTGWAARALAAVRSQQHTVLVLHDLPNGAMDALPGFLDEIEAMDVSITQTLPDSCVWLRDGAPTRDLSAWTT